jgi:hypothetical protein
MKRARRRTLIAIALLALLAVNVCVLAFRRAPSDGGGGASSGGRPLAKDSGAGTGLDRSGEVPEVHNDTEAPFGLGVS